MFVDEPGCILNFGEVRSSYVHALYEIDAILAKFYYVRHLRYGFYLRKRIIIFLTVLG